MEKQREQVPLDSESLAHAVCLCLMNPLGLVQMCCFHLKVERCSTCSVLVFRASYYTQFRRAISSNSLWSPMVMCSVSTAGLVAMAVVALEMGDSCWQKRSWPYS